jgi:carbon monoxide dehydrogenase subunit G
MPEASNSVVIERPVGEVFSFLSNPENDKRWRPGVIELRRKSGEGAGAVYEQRVKGPLGSKVAADIEIVAIEPERRIAFRTIAGPVRPEGRYELEPVDGGTRVTLELRADLSGPSKLMAPMVASTMRSEVGQLERLRQELERGVS